MAPPGRYFELKDEAPYQYYVSEFRAKDPQRGACMLPKRSCDVRRRLFARTPRGTHAHTRAGGHARWRRGPVPASACGTDGPVPFLSRRFGIAARVTVRRRAVSRLQVLKCEIGRCSNSRALAAHPRTWLRQAARGGLGCEVTCPQRHHRLFEAIRCGFDSIGAAAPLASVAVLPRPVSASIFGQCRLCERRGAVCGAACADSACFRTR